MGIQNRLFGWARYLLIPNFIFLILADGNLFAQMAGPPVPGLHAYTMAHAMKTDPPDRIGKPVKVKVTQENGSTRFVLPGPRFLDPSVFGTPENPVGFDPAPFPLLGVPLEMRKAHNGKYTFVNHATAFSDWYEVGVGSVKMKLKDVTAIDGARTKDKVDFEATSICRMEATTG
ncbi:MAG: hypothetical protein ACE5GV_04230 [Candidatus Scalindua sp.]